MNYGIGRGYMTHELRIGRGYMTHELRDREGVHDT